MKYSALGHTGLLVSRIGLGTGKLTSASSGISRKQAVDVIHAATSHGVNLIDTADIYGQGDSETVIGQALRGKRHEVILASKIGYRFANSVRLVALVKPVLRPLVRRIRGASKLVEDARQRASSAKMLRQDFSADHLENAVNASLRRLRTDNLDILFLHDPPAAAVRSEEVLQVLARIKKAGKVRHFGVSTPDVSILELARRQPEFAVVQTAVHPKRPVSLWSTLDELSAAQFGVVANHIFGAGGMLSADLDAQIDAKIVKLSQRKGLSPRQLLLGFATRLVPINTVVIGTTNVDHLHENIADLDLVHKVPPAELIT